MNTTKNGIEGVLLRTIVVAGCGMLAGFCFYQLQIFMPTMRASQFVTSSITAGITYSAIRNSSRRDGFAALLIWYIILTGLIVDFNSWILILNLVYVAVIATAIFVYNYFVQKPFLHSAFRRIVVAVGCIAFANGLIIMVLGLVSYQSTFLQPSSVLLYAYHNIQLGALIGLGIGIGIEAAEYLITKIDEHRFHSVDIKQAS